MHVASSGHIESYPSGYFREPLTGLVFVAGANEQMPGVTAMNAFRKTFFLSALAVVGAAGLIPLACAQAAPAYRDGSHDFDFHIGTWHTHIRSLQHPLSGSTTWTELNGTVTVRKIWGGKGSVEELQANGPDQHIEGLTLFLYNPQSHQWSQTFISSSDGAIGTPAIGAFKDGRGELIDQESYQGRAILVRNVWSDIRPNSQRFEISYSDDNGKTWEPNFVADLTRIQ
jgi:hypothetical protein